MIGAILEAGIELLGDAGWESQYQLAYDLHLEAGECEYMAGNADPAEELFEELLVNGKSSLEKAKVYGLRSHLYTMQGRHEESIKA